MIAKIKLNVHRSVKKVQTKFQCVVCGKLTAGRIGREGSYTGDTSHRYPRRHKVNGKECLGNIQEAKWVDVPL